MTLYPGQLGCGEPGKRGVASDLNQLVISHCACDAVSFCLASLVAPDDGRTKHLMLLVEQHQPVHLARQPNALNGIAFNSSAVEHSGYSLSGRRPPVLRVLLRPLRLRRADRL